MKIKLKLDPGKRIETSTLPVNKLEGYYIINNVEWSEIIS